MCCYRWDVIVKVGGVDVCGRMWGEQYILSLPSVACRGHSLRVAVSTRLERLKIAAKQFDFFENAIVWVHRFFAFELF